MSNTAVILQPNYIPWRGYFDLMARADVFVIYDDAQYTRRDWRNRNRIWLDGKPRWLTIPVEVKGRYTQAIKDVRTARSGWQQKHWATLSHAYAKAPCFAEVAALLEPLYLSADYAWLLDADLAFLTAIRDWLGIDTPFVMSSALGAAGAKSEKLIALCRRVEADRYLSGPAAKAYIDPAAFSDAGIALSFIDYGEYPAYRSGDGAAERHLSILDAMFMLGERARDFISGSTLEEAA